MMPCNRCERTSFIFLLLFHSLLSIDPGDQPSPPSVNPSAIEELLFAVDLKNIMYNSVKFGDDGEDHIPSASMRANSSLMRSFSYTKSTKNRSSVKIDDEFPVDITRAEVRVSQ